MKMLYRLLRVSAILMALTLSVLGQTIPLPISSAAINMESEEDEKQLLYQKFLSTRQNDQASAFKAGKDYLQRWPDDTAESVYVKKWVNYYETEWRKWHIQKLIAEGKVDEAFAIGKRMLVSNPNDLQTLNILVDGGLAAYTDGNRAFMDDAATFAKKALLLIDADPRQGPEKEASKSRLNLLLGILYLSTDPAQSVAYFDKFSQFEPFKKDPLMYARVADAIMRAEYPAIHKEFNTRFRTPEERVSDAAGPVRAKLFQLVDFMVDTLARAVALAGSDRRFETEKKQWMTTLTELYKYRNSGYETGLAQLINGILDEPFPPRPEP